MDPVTLKLLHYAGALALFMSLGATLLAKSGGKTSAMLHGISLLLLIVIGFAMLKKPLMDQYWWMVKIAMWLFLGAAPTLARRKVLPHSLVLGLSLAAGIFAAYLGNYKPF